MSRFTIEVAPSLAGPGGWIGRMFDGEREVWRRFYDGSEYVTRASMLDDAERALRAQLVTPSDVDTGGG